MILVLDMLFVHRLRGQEGKDGNPLNEVRILCNSIMNNQGVMGEDSTIRFVPDKSVLKYCVGDEIKLNAANFAGLANAFFAEIERKFM